MSGRKWVLLVGVVAGLIAAAAMSFAPPKPSLLLLDWASKSKADTAADRRPHRNGPQGRDADRLVEPGDRRPGRRWSTAKATASATATS